MTGATMFCTHCGKRNPDDANFCFSCGTVLPVRSAVLASGDSVAVPGFVTSATVHTHTSAAETAVGKGCPVCGSFNPGVAERCDCGYSFVTATAPVGRLPLFPVATHKFIVLSICTFGIYQLYWCYQNWKRLKGPNERMSPFWRTLFAPLWAFQLFTRVRDRVHRGGVAVEWNARGLATVFLVLNLLWRLPDPWWLVSFLTIVPMIPVQQSAQRLNDLVGLGESRNTGYTTANVITMVIGGTLFVLSIIDAVSLAVK
jgi:hypothetical protein